MKKYVKAIQNIQKDMEIKTASFPRFGLYGDVLIVNDKYGRRLVLENHSTLKKEHEEYEKCVKETDGEFKKDTRKVAKTR